MQWLWKWGKSVGNVNIFLSYAGNFLVKWLKKRNESYNSAKVITLSLATFILEKNKTTLTYDTWKKKSPETSELESHKYNGGVNSETHGWLRTRFSYLQKIERIRIALTANLHIGKNNVGNFFKTCFWKSFFKKEIDFWTWISQEWPYIHVSKQQSNRKLNISYICVQHGATI